MSRLSSLHQLTFYCNMYNAMQQIVLRISDQQKQLLQQLADSQQVTLSELVRTALDSYAATYTSKKSGNGLLQLASIADPTLPGPKDLSTTYKTHLYTHE